MWSSTFNCSTPSNKSALSPAREFHSVVFDGGVEDMTWLTVDIDVQTTPEELLGMLSQKNVSSPPVATNLPESAIRTRQHTPKWR
jgi:hypothetical protein